MPRPIPATPRREPFTMLIIRLNPRASEESVLGLLRMYASVSTKSTSAVGTERVPSLSLIRLMRMLLGGPSARGTGARKRAGPRRPGGGAARGGRGPLGPGRGGVPFGVHVGAEPLGAVEQPAGLAAAGGGAGRRLRGRQVGAAAPPGHENPALPAGL